MVRTLAILAAIAAIALVHLPTKVDAQHALTLAQGGGESAQVSAAPADIDGETMFATSCGFCHQNGGRASGKGPKLAGTTRSDDFLVERIKKGKPGAMPAFGGAFSESQIMAIVGYIRTLEE
jgi:mono/diheme cytochrome c family protein